MSNLSTICVSWTYEGEDALRKDELEVDAPDYDTKLILAGRYGLTTDGITVLTETTTQAP